MREIKFRVWSKTHKKMFHQDTFKDALKGLINLAKGYLGRCDIKSGMYLPTEDVDLVFMQYTGLKDKNGKEIYEGDILLFTSKNGEESMCQVVFGNAAFIAEWIEEKYFRTDLDWWNTRTGVIGNIYANPELLEVNHE